MLQKQENQKKYKLLTIIQEIHFLLLLEIEIKILIFAKI